MHEINATTTTTTRSNEEQAPIMRLQALLEEQFPACKEIRKKDGIFRPHMTVSHFGSLEAAREAKVDLESWWTGASFLCDEIYVLRRQGDGGQFLRIATVSFRERRVFCHDDVYNEQQGTHGLAFSGMPLIEEDWMLEERMKMKDRRRNNAYPQRWKIRRDKKKKEKAAAAAAAAAAAMNKTSIGENVPVDVIVEDNDPRGPSTSIMGGSTPEDIAAITREHSKKNTWRRILD